MRFRSFALVDLLLLSGLSAQIGAQSLADVARKEEARRQGITRPAKVLSNKDLKSVPAAEPPASEKKPAPETAASSEPDKGKDKDSTGDKAAKNGAEPVKDKAYWSGRLRDLQVQLDRDHAFADALQTRINVLTTDFVNRDDPAQRAGIERDRQKAMSELARLTTAIQNDQKALADFEEEARHAGVPSGWLR